jgi:hypothetical protein
MREEEVNHHPEIREDENQHQEIKEEVSHQLEIKEEASHQLEMTGMDVTSSSREALEREEMEKTMEGEDENEVKKRRNCTLLAFYISCKGNISDISLETSVKEGITQNNQHCSENLKHIFPEMKLFGLVPHFCINVSVSDLYIPTIGPPTLLYCVCEPIVEIYKLLTDTKMQKLRNEAAQFYFWEFSLQCICS